MLLQDTVDHNSKPLCKLDIRFFAWTFKESGFHENFVFTDRCKMGLQHDADEPLSLKGLVDLFHMLQDKYYEEYKV